MITFFKRIGAKTRGRIGQTGVKSVVSDFERAFAKLQAAEQHLNAEAESNADKVLAIMARDAQIAKDRLRAIRLQTKLSEFI